jgi:hypothetical protein
LAELHHEQLIPSSVDKLRSSFHYGTLYEIIDAARADDMVNLANDHTLGA